MSLLKDLAFDIRRSWRRGGGPGKAFLIFAAVIAVAMVATIVASLWDMWRTLA